MKTKKIIEGEYIILGSQAKYNEENVYRIDSVVGRWAVVSREHHFRDSTCYIWERDTLASFLKRCEEEFYESKKGVRAYRVIDLLNGMVSNRAAYRIGTSEYIAQGELLLENSSNIIGLRVPSETADSEILKLQSEILLDYDLDASYLNKIGGSNLDKAVEELNETEL